MEGPGDALTEDGAAAVRGSPRLELERVLVLEELERILHPQRAEARPPHSPLYAVAILGVQWPFEVPDDSDGDDGGYGDSLGLSNSHGTSWASRACICSPA